MVGLFNFKVVARPYRMHKSFQSIFVFNNSTWFLTQCNHIDAIFWKDQEIICAQKKTFNWWLPKLVTFMPVLNQFSFQVNDEDVESVDSNTLVADHNRLSLLAINILI